MRRRPGFALVLALALAAWLPSFAQPAPGASAPEAAALLADLVDRLSAASDAEVAPLVVQLEAMPDSPSTAAAMPDALFVAARACEERLLAPGRALALYERILAQYPDARVAIAAGRRAAHLRAQVGSAGTSTKEAQDFARLVAGADAMPIVEALRQADALAALPWGGAAEVLLWSAELARRRGATGADAADARGDIREAIRRYQAVRARFPGSPEAELAVRGLAGAAVEARDWDLAESMTRRLHIADDADAVTRDELLGKISTGRAADRWAARAAVVLIFIALALVASFFQVVGWRPSVAHLRALRPPLELVYMAPIAAIFWGASLTAHTSIAPAVLRILGGGLALAWLSGATLARAREQERARVLRTALHLGGCAVATIALAYLAIVGTGLLDLLLATIRLGPEL